MGSNDGFGAGTDQETRFEVAPGVEVEVRSASGDLLLREGSPGECVVRFRYDGPDAERRLGEVECRYDAATNRLLVETNRGISRLGDLTGGLRSTFTRLFEGARHDVDVEMVVPVGTSVRFRTASGDLMGQVSLGGLDVSSASGDVVTGTVTGDVSLTTASGDLALEAVGGSASVKVASGDVILGRVSGDLTVQTVSGDAIVTLAGATDALVNSVSGDVIVRVVPGLLLDLDANSVSGDLSSEIPLGSGDGDGSGETPLRLKVRTVSGNVKVCRA
jgi:hypothetical protein